MRPFAFSRPMCCSATLSFWGEICKGAHGCLGPFRISSCTFLSPFLFRAADKTLVYLTLFISEALNSIGSNADIDSAKKEMYSLSIKDFWVPGHKDWPLAGFTSKPGNRAEQDQTRAWMAQLRQECGVRLCDKVFANSPDGKPSKWWVCFQRKKFMNKQLWDEGRR